MSFSPVTLQAGADETEQKTPYKFSRRQYKRKNNFIERIFARLRTLEFGAFCPRPKCAKRKSRSVLTASATRPPAKAAG